MAEPSSKYHKNLLDIITNKCTKTHYLYQIKFLICHIHNHTQSNMQRNSCYASSVNNCHIYCVPAVCIKDPTTVLSGGQVSRKLSYKDHVLELTYEGGSPCAANPALKHTTVMQFICRYLKPSLCPV